MSGGSFNYAFSHTATFAEDLGLRLDEWDKPDRYGDYPNRFEQATRDKLREIQVLAERCAKLMKEAEWLYSSDTGEETFMARVAKIEAGAP